MKKRFYSALYQLWCRLWRRYIYPTESLFGTWGIYYEHGVNAKGRFYKDCTLLDSWMIIEPENGGYWDERGEIESLRWHRIGCRCIAVSYPDLVLFRKIVRLTRNELWLKSECENSSYWRIERYRRGTPPPDPEPIYEQYCAARDGADDRPNS